MTLLLGTRDGLYRTDSVPFDETERVLSGCGVPSIAVGEAVFAVLDGDLYRSPEGREFDSVEVTSDRVRTVVIGPQGTLYAGADPARLFLSGDGGDSWTELDGLRSAFRAEWETRGGTDGVSTVGVAPSLPRRILVGVESRGVLVSDDGGETFVERGYGLHDDVHDVTVESPREFLAATGRGLYRTGDAGRTWTRMDTDTTYFEYTYFRAIAHHDGEWYTGAAAGAPGQWNADIDAVMAASSDGETFERILLSLQGEYVAAFGEYDGGILAGTLSQDPGRPGTRPAHVLYNDCGNWEVAGETPAGVWSLAEV